jgi:hypothetical protein
MTKKQKIVRPLCFALFLLIKRPELPETVPPYNTPHYHTRALVNPNDHLAPEHNPCTGSHTRDKRTPSHDVSDVAVAEYTVVPLKGTYQPSVPF